MSTRGQWLICPRLSSPVLSHGLLRRATAVELPPHQLGEINELIGSASSDARFSSIASALGP